MIRSEHPGSQAEALLETPHISEVLDQRQFREFLDRLPFAIAVSTLRGPERITFANPEFERITGVSETGLIGQGWGAASGDAVGSERAQRLAAAILSSEEAAATHEVGRSGSETTVHVWSSVVREADGAPLDRLVALTLLPPDTDEYENKLREKDLLLRELQHRVSNNLQMITALIRMEAKSVGKADMAKSFDRLAGRINSLAVLYHSLSAASSSGAIDLGSYLSEIASTVMRAHATEGIRLDLKVDSWPVSVNVAMPTGLVVNELLTNALKHAFVGRGGGTIRLHSLVDDTGCKVVVADDGNGLAEPNHWPKQGKLSALIVESLKKNAKAKVDVESSPGAGLRVAISFDRESASAT